MKMNSFLHTAAKIIQNYELQAHPEGGFFKENYRSTSTLNTGHNTSTAIYFLLPKNSKSHLHRIKSDEVWHFYLGQPLTIVQINSEGEITKTVLGPNIKNQEKLQHIVPAGDWFGAYPNPDSEYSFVGCTVAPGFDFKDFELANRNELLSLYPSATKVIEKLTTR